MVEFFIYFYTHQKIILVLKAAVYGLFVNCPIILETTINVYFDDLTTPDANY